MVPEVNKIIRISSPPPKLFPKYGSELVINFSKLKFNEISFLFFIVLNLFLLLNFFIF